MQAHVSTRQESTAVLAHATGGTLSSGHVDTLAAGSALLLGGIDDALLDITGEGEEGLFHVDVALCRDLHEGDAEFVSQSLALGGGDSALLFPVTFVADEDLVDAFGGMLFDV